MMLQQLAGWQSVLAKPLHETLGPPLLAAATAAWLLAWRRTRERAALLLLVACAVLLVREINFEGADLFLVLATLALVAWGLRERGELQPSLQRLPAWGTLFVVAAFYALSNVCDLRPVRIATGGIGRVALEEPLETLGHATLIVAGVLALLGPRVRD